MAGCFYTPSMDEAALLRHIYARAGGAEHDAALGGPGDDCAVVDLGGDRACLLTTDQLIEGRHFEPGTPIEQIAWKAMARAVSDIAACAGEPVCALATGAMPDGYAHADALFDAMHRAAIELGCPLVGGDVARAGADGGVHLTTTLIGRVHATRGAVLRSGARSGDAVVVSGCLGGSFDARVDGDGVAHHLGFTPRVEAARRAADMLGDDLHAMMDLSDGLGVDVARLAEASGVMIEIDAAALPVDVRAHPRFGPQQMPIGLRHMRSQRLFKGVELQSKARPKGQKPRRLDTADHIQGRLPRAFCSGARIRNRRLERERILQACRLITGFASGFTFAQNGLGKGLILLFKLAQDDSVKHQSQGFHRQAPAPKQNLEAVLSADQPR